MARKKKEAAGAPEWMVTFGDMMSLLLTFFILLVAMSEVKQDKKFQDVMRSIRSAFGYVGGIGAVPTTVSPKMSLVQRLESIVVPKKPRNIGDSEDEGIEGKVFRVTQVREGLQFTVGGRISFDRFEAALRPEAAELLARLADRIRGLNTKVMIRGHATSEPLPEGTAYESKLDLSIARAHAAYDALVRNGIRKERLSVTGIGDSEPLLRQAYTEERRAVNRRVEVIMNEALISDYDGDPVPREEAMSSG